MFLSSRPLCLCVLLSVVSVFSLQTFIRRPGDFVSFIYCLFVEKSLLEENDCKMKNTSNR